MSDKNVIDKKMPKERDTLDLVELVCQLHSRATMYHRSKEMHDSYMEAREELDRRVKGFDDLLDHLKERREEAIFIHGKCKEDKQISFVKGRLTELTHFISLLNSEEDERI